MNQRESIFTISIWEDFGEFGKLSFIITHCILFVRLEKSKIRWMSDSWKIIKILLMIFVLFSLMTSVFIGSVNYAQFGEFWTRKWRTIFWNFGFLGKPEYFTYTLAGSLSLPEILISSSIWIILGSLKLNAMLSLDIFKCFKFPFNLLKILFFDNF